MPNNALVLVAAAVMGAREKPSTYSSRRPTIVDQVVSFTIATDDVIETVPPPLALCRPSWATCDNPRWPPLIMSVISAFQRLNESLSQNRFVN
jgi:hypothetical protein